MDAHARLMGLEVRALQEAHVVGSDRRDAPRARELNQVACAGPLAAAPRALRLEVEAVAEEVKPGIEAAGRLIIALARAGAADVTLRAARERHEARQGLAGQPGALEHRHAALLPLQVGAGHEARQVAIAGEVLAQQDDLRGQRTITAFPYPRINPDQWLHAACQRLLVELDHRKQIALIGQRDCGHPGRGHRDHQFRHAQDGVDQGVLRVYPQVDELAQAALSFER